MGVDGETCENLTEEPPAERVENISINKTANVY